MIPRYWECGVHITPKDVEYNDFRVKLYSHSIEEDGYIGGIFYGEDSSNLYKTYFSGLELQLSPSEIDITKSQLARMTFMRQGNLDLEGRLLSMYMDHNTSYFHYAVRIESIPGGYKFTGKKNTSGTYSSLYDKNCKEFHTYKCAMMYGSDRYRSKKQFDTFHSEKRIDEVDKLIA